MSEWSASSDKAGAVWTCLTEMFGSRLTRDYGESVPDAWRNAINSLNDYQLARGLRRVLARGSASAPTLPQFAKACRDVSSDDDERPAPVQQQIELQDLRTKFEAFADHLLLNFFMRNGGGSRACLPRMLAEKKRLCDGYLQISAEEHVTPEEFRDALVKAWRKVFEAQPASECKADLGQLQRIGYVTGKELITDSVEEAA